MKPHIGDRKKVNFEFHEQRNKNRYFESRIRIILFIYFYYRLLNKLFFKNYTFIMIKMGLFGTREKQRENVNFGEFIIYCYNKIANKAENYIFNKKALKNFNFV